MEQYGSTSTYNFESVLRQNILSSDYFRNDCAGLSTWSAVVDAIYEEVDMVEPWMSGNMRGPSTAFCLLYRLCQLKPTEVEVRQTITHQDSPYIRAVGFLYLRYVCDPRNIWEWMAPFVDDAEEFQPSGPNETTVTMGDFVRDVLLELYYFETLFPRIPKKVEDQIASGLRAKSLPTTGKGNGGAGGADRRGVEDGVRRPASVKASLSVAFGQRAPNRAGVREDGARRGEERFGGGQAHPAGGARPAAGGAREREGRRDRGESPQRRGGADHDDERRRDERERGHAGRERGGYADRERGGYVDRGRGYSERERAHADRERGGGGYADRERGYADRERGSSYHRSRSRSRERSRDGGEGRGARDVFREGAGAARSSGGGGGVGDLKSRYGDANGSELFDRRGGERRRERGEEVLRIGGKGSGGSYR